MHDDRVEDALRTVLRKEGDDLTLNITAQELERRLALRRRERASRRISLVAAAVAVIAIGGIVSVGNGWIGRSTVGFGGASTQTALAGSPTATSDVAACVAIDPNIDDLPKVAMAATPGDAISPYPGVVGAYRVADHQVGVAGLWGVQVPEDSDIVPVLPDQQLRVGTTDAAACIGNASAAAVPFGEGASASNTSTLTTSTAQPGRYIDFDPPPAGDWLVRVHVEYATDGRGSAWSDTFFHVLVRGANAETSPSPTVDGGLGCKAVDPSTSSTLWSVVAGVVPGDSIGYGGTVVASRWNGVDSGSPGSWDGLPGDSDAIAVRPWDQVLEFISDGCLTDVTAEALLTVYAQVPVPSPTPIELRIIGGVGSRVVDIEPPPTGGWTVRVRADFMTTDGSEAWSETLYRVFGLFDAPKLTMSQGAGGDSRWAAAKCATYQLASGASAEDQCGGTYEPIAGTDPLVVPAGSRGNRLDFSLSGDWRIDQARVTAVQADLVAAGKNAPEYSVAFIDKGGLTVAVPIVLDPGSWIVRVSLNGSKGGDRFDAYYDLPLQVGPS